MKNPATQHNTVLYKMKEVERRTTLSKSSIYKMVKIHEFPAPISLTSKPGGAVAWDSTLVDEWIEKKCSNAANTLVQATAKHGGKS